MAMCPDVPAVADHEHGPIGHCPVEESAVREAALGQVLVVEAHRRHRRAIRIVRCSRGEDVGDLVEVGCVHEGGTVEYSRISDRVHVGVTHGGGDHPAETLDGGAPVVEGMGAADGLDTAVPQ